ncbi:CopG family transcriptional regulator [Nostoc sp. TCL26-01]|uniref:CopG family transcriptional regulator n=1 Tax=Nostoc sp. TCL26-01 TaxID=2576904 RepID=UPI0015BD65B3|nr:CopG family transcriptional regulator [Nostoc sp. TCL26-01]QLE58412.1 CopG family transcriptional regulator [Nostoc sp. TCL26-01]
MKKTSRFDDLIDAARSRQQRDQPASNVEQTTAQSKSTDPAYTRTTLYLPKQLHRQLKASAVAQERQMSDIVAELIEQWLVGKEANSDTES